MMRLSPTSWTAIGIVAALQTAVLGWMVWDRVSLLRHGREIVVEVVPLDPRDLFRGDYVIFGYAFSRTGEIPVTAGTRQGDVVYVTLKPQDDNHWELVKVDAAYPEMTEAGNVVLKGFTTYIFQGDPPAGPTASLRYGIESYFVPEGTGRELEELVRDKKIAAVIAVGRDGEAAIKALMIDGKRVVEEPLL